MIGQPLHSDDRDNITDHRPRTAHSCRNRGQDLVPPSGEQPEERFRFAFVGRLAQNPAPERHSRIGRENDLAAARVHSRRLAFRHPAAIGSRQFAFPDRFVDVGRPHFGGLDSNPAEQFDAARACGRKNDSRDAHLNR